MVLLGDWPPRRNSQRVSGEAVLKPDLSWGQAECQPTVPAFGPESFLLSASAVRGVQAEAHEVARGKPQPHPDSASSVNRSIERSGLEEQLGGDSYMNLRGWARLSQMMWSPLLGDPDGEDTSLTRGSLTKASPLAAGPVTSPCLLYWLVLGQTHPPSLCSRPLVWGSFGKLENGWLEETEGHVAQTLRGQLQSLPEKHMPKWNKTPTWGKAVVPGVWALKPALWRA